MTENVQTKRPPRSTSLTIQHKIDEERFMKVLVTGGTGNVGSKVINELLKRNVAVRAIVRTQETDKLPGPIETVVGDLLDPVSVEKALQDVDKIYLLNAVVPDELTQGLIVFDLAKRLKLKHLVYHSVFRVDQFKDVPHFASKLAIENALREFDLPYTILRPNYFYQNDLSLKDVLTNSGVYPMPLGDEGVSAVDVRDIAEAVAIILSTDGHFGKTYNLVGPDVLSGPAVAAIWGGVLGRDVRYAGHDMDIFEDQMRKQAPSWSAFDIRMMFQGYLERGFTADEDDVAALTRLLGHPLRKYEDFAKEAAATWQGPAQKRVAHDKRTVAA
jgi:uncharacterized protein YbjT (DUF2867 family)